MRTIEPTIQESIVDILPQDYDLAMGLMCQLLANMMLSGDAPWDINKTIAELKANLAAYAGT
jgi:hypothetical protein